MRAASNALRLHVESALAGRVVSPFRFQEPQIVAVSTGIAEVDQLSGGLPRGCLTEIFGDISSGVTSLLQAALAARTANAEVCALVDATDSFDPGGAQSAGITLQKLLWVRCRNIDQALRSVDLLLHGGGFSLIAVDLTGAPSRLVRHIPLSFWFRLRRAVENTSTILLVLSRESNAKTCASLVLRMERADAQWRLSQRNIRTNELHTPGSLLDGWTIDAEMIRSRTKRNNVAVMGRPETFGKASANGKFFSDSSLSNTNTEVARVSLFTNHFSPVDPAGNLPPIPQELEKERTLNHG
jgi:hypothetical protein